MSGNVWEWCSDMHGAYPTDASVDLLGASSGPDRIVRSGSWSAGLADPRVAHHFWFSPPMSHNDPDLRLARSD
ncbi:MAG: sulfatase activating formylglycine-generating enzyme [Myxococcota bacterium]|jgi:formylglycine-generating enzyme required for sulfatase activity